MTKTGNLETGVTPSVCSGRPCDRIEDGEPVCEGESPVDPGLKKLAATLSPTDPDGP